MKVNYKTDAFTAIIIVLLIATIITTCLALKNNEANNKLEAVQNELSITKNNLQLKSDEVVKLSTVLDDTNKNLEEIQIELDDAYNDMIDLNEKLTSVNWATNFDISEKEIEMIAKTVLGEAGNCTRFEQSAVIWCILNRVDSGNQTITQVITAPNQFHGYNPKWVVKPDIYALTIDVLTRWQLEKVGIGNVGRTLPKDFKWFYGDGKHNYFRNEFSGDYDTWDWNCWNPYE